MDFLVVAYVAQFCTSSVDYIKKKNKLRHVQYSMCEKSDGPEQKKVTLI